MDTLTPRQVALQSLTQCRDHHPATGPARRLKAINIAQLEAYIADLDRDGDAA
jgi:hypothetical protein